MFKLKSAVISLALILLLITVNLLPVQVSADEIQLAKESVTAGNQQGYTLTWKDVQGGKVLEKVTVDAVDFTYTYNYNKNRISKTSKNGTVTYTYNNEFRLISEVRGNNLFTYLYEDRNSMAGFTLNNLTYNFVKDWASNVIAIADADNNEVVKYEYDQNGIVSAVLGKDSRGRWTDMSRDSSFVGTLNLIRLHSYYYDAETGWYYNGYKYYDSVGNKYLEETDSTNSISASEDVKKDSKAAAPAISPDLVVQITNWKNSLMSSPDFGKSIPYSRGWYNCLSDVEILSRLLYGENTINSADQNSVAWVLINRKNNGSFGSSYRAIATAPGQFEPITGGSSGTANARTPDKSSDRWNTAVWSACTLLSTSNSAEYGELIPKPAGVSTQLYFVGLNYFLSRFSNGSPISKDVFPAGSGMAYSYNSGRSYLRIKDVVIVFDVYDTFQNPTGKSSITSNSRLNTSSLRARHNIFYNY